MVVASIALLIALGGTSIAAVTNVPDNSVGTAKIKSNAVTTPKIKNSAVNASKIASNAVVAAKIASNAVVAAKIASNAVTSAKIANGTIQPDDLSASAKTAGPQGPPGPTGPSGPAGAAAAAFWASVDQNGTLIRNKGAASAQRNGIGQFQVVFNQDVTGCVYLANTGGPGQNAVPLVGEISASQLPNVAAGVRVFVTNATATAFADLPFFVAVFC
jgi:hypothetical protein